jgi:hypothetical protein
MQEKYNSFEEVIIDMCIINGIQWEGKDPGQVIIDLIQYEIEVYKFFRNEDEKYNLLDSTDDDFVV